MSAQRPLPAQLLFLLGAWHGLEAQASAATHWPLQLTKGALHTQVVGLLAGEGENPSVQVNPQVVPATQAGVLFSG